MKITRSEFYEEYGDIQVSFIFYYKYMFHFEAKLPDNKRVVVVVGGDSDEIYRFELNNNTPIYINDLTIVYAYVYEDGKEQKYVDESY